jgi:glycosyltransferase involved in cell wall biosynthesis
MMQRPKIHILWEFLDGPWGGGNQFLKALRREFIKNGVYTDNAANAEIILFNSHQFQKQTLRLKLQYPEKIFVHRVDGPIFQTRGESGIVTDNKIFFCNDIAADATVFQSEWSKNASYRQGLKKTPFEACIINAPDPDIFHPEATRRGANRENRKTRLVTTTWSSNPRKGFDIFRYLDEHLDFSNYAMTFVGNTEIAFKNIETIGPQPSDRLAEILRSHHIFIAASRNEPCSNSFLEALHCGLPAVARNDSSYPELLRGNGLLFSGEDDILEKIDAVAANPGSYVQSHNLPRIDEVAQNYLEFFAEISSQVRQKKYRPKRLSRLKYYFARLRLKSM